MRGSVVVFLSVLLVETCAEVDCIKKFNFSLNRNFPKILGNHKADNFVSWGLK